MPISEEQRGAGLIFVDPDHPVDAPAAHVLVVGVGAYPKANLAPLTSPIASATILAGWFLGRQGDGGTRIEDGFYNSEKPLGSLALLLSNPADPDVANTEAAPMMFGGEPVLRATMLNMKAAVAAWVDRARTNRDNLAILYLCGHGFSDDGHTGFVLEDRDSNAKDLTNGLIDLTMFRRRLARLPIRSQLLLFDCCRTHMDLDVPEDDPIGEAFLEREAFPGRDILQMALFATLPNEIATGRRNKASFYTESLIMALTHAAADKDSGSWVVSSGQLYAKMQSILRLFAVSEEDFQRLDSEALADFPIHLPTIARDEVPTYVSLADPGRWDEAVICLKRQDGNEEILTKEGSHRFISRRLKYELPVVISAKYLDGTVVIYEGEPDRPVCFARIGQAGSAKVSVDRQLRTRGVGRVTVGAPSSPANMPNDRIWKNANKGGGVFLDLKSIADALLELPKAAIDGIKDMLPRRGGPSPIPNTVTATLKIVTPGGSARPAGLLFIKNSDGSKTISPTAAQAEMGVAIMPGTYRVSLDLSDGQTLSRSVDVAPSQIVTVEFRPGVPPRDWLAIATESGALPMQFRGIDQIDARVTADVKARFLAPLTFRHPPSDEEEVGATFEPARVAGPISRIDVEETSSNRFRKAAAGVASEQPLWARVSVGVENFDLAIPAVGKNRSSQDWKPHVLALTHDGRGHAISQVDAGPFASLFAFLARRDFLAAGRAFNEVSRIAGLRAAILGHENPVLGAVSAAAVIASGTTQAVLDDGWFRTFVEQHPSLPDAGILAARRIWTDGDFEKRRDEVRKLLTNSFKAGVPLLSLSLDWLASGLRELDDDETRAMAREAGGLVRLSIQSTLFTTIVQPKSQAGE